MKENKKLVNEIISDVKHDMSNEEIIALLADSRIADCNHKHSIRILSIIRYLPQNRNPIHLIRKRFVVVQEAEQRISTAEDNVRDNLSVTAGSDHNDLLIHEMQPPFP